MSRLNLAIAAAVAAVGLMATAPKGQKSASASGSNPYRCRTVAIIPRGASIILIILEAMKCGTGTAAMWVAATRVVADARTSVIHYRGHP